ncbi:MAG TPA: hypothetical protein VLV46_11450 [Gaiellaceae bacterium]|nr:hypothetical protein [Gaiellaceae bacterium]
MADALTSLLVAVVLAVAPLKATLTGPTHSPKINKRWYYVVKVTQNGRPAHVKMTAQIVDPLGGTHPVEFGPTTRKIVNWPVTGRYRDYIIWPSDSRGIPLKLRITLVGAHGARTVVSYAVVPHA